MNHVPSEDLRADLLPPPGAPWSEIYNFAHTFNAYDYHDSFEGAASIANAERTGDETLDELRTCLFFEARRYRYYGWDPGEKDMVYIHGLLESVRDRVAK